MPLHGFKTAKSNRPNGPPFTRASRLSKLRFKQKKMASTGKSTVKKNRAQKTRPLATAGVSDGDRNKEEGDNKKKGGVKKIQNHQKPADPKERNSTRKMGARKKKAKGGSGKIYYVANGIKKCARTDSQNKRQWPTDAKKRGGRREKRSETNEEARKNPTGWEEGP